MVDCIRSKWCASEDALEVQPDHSLLVVTKVVIDRLSGSDAAEPAAIEALAREAPPGLCNSAGPNRRSLPSQITRAAPGRRGTRP